MLRRALAALVLVLVLAAPAAASAPQDLADRTEAWLQAELGTAPLRRPVVLGDAAELQACAGLAYMQGRGACVGLAYSDRIELDAITIDGLERTALTSRGRWVVLGGDAYQTLLHELLHRGDAADLLQEGLVDALAYDLEPAASRAAIGVPLPPRPPAYTAEVHLVRKASAIACSSTWRSRCARGMRRAWWAADSDTRHAVIGALVGRP